MAIPETPLHNMELEMAALGAMLLSERAKEEAMAMLRVEHFYRPGHRILFNAMAGLQGEIDYLVLVSALGDQLKDVGGEDYVIQVAQFVPSAANIEHYCKGIRECYARRVAAAQAKRLEAVASDMTKSPDEVRALMQEIGETIAESPVAFLDLSEVSIDDDGDTGVPTGYPCLDSLISTGGYPIGQMTIVRAYHKGGKTAFMTGSALDCAERGLRVLYATFADLNAKQLKRRIMRQSTGWGKRPLKDFDTMAVFDKQLEDIDNYWFFKVYDASALDTGDDVETFIQWLKVAHKKYRFDVVFVDYAQELRSRDRKATNEVSEQNIAAHKLNRAAAQLALPFVIGSQITEGGEGQKAKTKYSRAWEEKAGWVLTLERVEKHVNVEVSYSRFGVQNVKRTLDWDDDRIRMIDYLNPAHKVKTAA